MRRLLDEMWAVAREERPDVIVYHAKASAAVFIAEALQSVAVPAFQIPAFVPTGAFANPIFRISGPGALGRRLGHKALLWLMTAVTSRMTRSWRRDRLRLADNRRPDLLGGYDPQGHTTVRLHGYSRHLVPKTEAWPEREKVTGYWFLDQAGGWQPPDRAAAVSRPGAAARLCRFRQHAGCRCRAAYKDRARRAPSRWAEGYPGDGLGRDWRRSTSPTPCI